MNLRLNYDDLLSLFEAIRSLYDFCKFAITKIPGLRDAHYRDFGIENTAEIPELGIAGFQSLLSECFLQCQQC